MVVFLLAIAAARPVHALDTDAVGKLAFGEADEKIAAIAAPTDFLASTNEFQEINSSFAEQTVASLQLEGRFAIINVGAGWVSKIWPSNRYATIAKHLGEHWGMPCLVVWSGEKEKFTAEQVVAGSGGHATLSPATTLSQLGSLIRRSSLFVGSDTGPMHLSVANGTPTIGLIGPMPIARVGPYGTNNAGVQNVRLMTASARKTDCTPMLSISSEEVMRVCDQLMDRCLLARRAS